MLDMRNEQSRAEKKTIKVKIKGDTNNAKVRKMVKGVGGM
jgi:hypothetical protein